MNPFRFDSLFFAAGIDPASACHMRRQKRLERLREMKLLDRDKGRNQT